MDWIEQLFGISPDGGDGSLEALIVTACCAIVLLIILGYFRRPLRQWLEGPKQ
jgi:hypothetical protein